jgi:hypothetical protein
MFSTFIRLGAALSCAAMLSSCGGNSVAETQQSTPEGLYTGNLKVSLANSAGTAVPFPNGSTTCTESVVQFAVATGSIYTFYPSATHPEVLNAADTGSLVFGGDAMNSSVLQVIAPASVAGGSAVGSIPAGLYTPMCDNFTGNATVASMVGGYQTGVNLTETYTYGSTDINGYTNVTTTDATTLRYDADYQGVQNLSTLAGTFNGYVSTSQKSEPATFTIGPPSVPANAGNSLGVSVLTGTTASGCAYSGSVSPLFKGNGYTISMSSGTAPCLLPQTQFVGLIYLNTKTNILYSFAPNQGRTDGVIFSGTRS